MTYHVGIDLGTTFTAAAVSRDDAPEIVALGDRSTVIPSVLFHKEDGTFLVGDAAERQGLSNPARLARQFKRRVGDSTPLLLGGTPFSPQALTAELLKWTIGRVSERQGGPPCRVALTHPANWRSFKIDLLGQAIELAGLDGATLISEPEAAALHWSSQERVEVGTRVVVYDLGGGTFDVAILEKLETGFRFMGPAYGIEHLGGLDFDAALLHQVRTLHEDAFDELDTSDPVVQAAASRLRADCSAAKETLSSDTSTMIPLLFPGLSSEVRVNRSEFEATIRPSINSTLDAVDRALERAGMTATDIDSVLLVGGSSRIPLVSQMVGARLARPVSVDTHPKHAIALGAAFVLDLLPAEALPEQTPPSLLQNGASTQHGDAQPAAPHQDATVIETPPRIELEPEPMAPTNGASGIGPAPTRLVGEPSGAPAELFDAVNPVSGAVVALEHSIESMSSTEIDVASREVATATPHRNDRAVTPVGAPEVTRKLRKGPLVGLLGLVVVAAVGIWWVLSPRDALAEAPQPVWQFETRSALASKPVVGSDTLVLGATTTNKIHAIDTSDGTERWEFETGGSVQAAGAIEDGVVYIGSFDGSMYAIDVVSGRLIWEAPVGAEVTGGSLVDGDRVFVGADDGAFVALDRTTGEELWRQDTGNEWGTKLNSNPQMAELEGVPVVIVGSTNGTLFAFDPATGDEQLSVSLEGGIWFSTPLVLDREDDTGQEVWIGTSTEGGGFLNRIVLDTAVVTTFSTGGGVGTKPVLTNDGLIVVGNDVGELFAVDRVSMGEVWREGYAEDTQIKGSPVVFGDQVIFGTHDRELIAVGDSDGRDQWRFQGEQVFGLSGPTVDGDRLYVGNDSGTVYAFTLE